VLAAAAKPATPAAGSAAATAAAPSGAGAASGSAAGDSAHDASHRATLAAMTADGERQREALRHELVQRLNALRHAGGAPPLARSAALDRAAQERVDAVVAAGSLKAEHEPQDAMARRLTAAGYEAQQWDESLVTGPENAAELIAAWHDDPAAGGYRRLLEPVYTEIGVGAGYLGDTPIYSVLCATPRAAVFSTSTASLRNVEQVRRELLVRINAERRRAKLPPLAENAKLEEAAQFHAQDMLARSYFAHVSPEGRSVRERSRAAGFEWQTIGENIAEGQTTVPQVADAWMASPEHRANILNTTFEETGIGLALGRDPHSATYRVLWVQTFGLHR
jgi:uncharacterized protein YkwD